MNEPNAPVTIALRIPGRWTHPQELARGLPNGYRLTPEALVMPDGTEIGFGAAAADDQFARVFRSSCRERPTEDELDTVENYAVNVFLSGPGGSLDAARTMMRAAAAVVRAGGAGVFIDNGAVAHGGETWLALTDDGSPDALTFAYVAIVSGEREVWTMGMHALGLRDVVMKRSDVEQGGFDIVEVIRYLAASEAPIEDGHILADLDGPRFKAVALEGDPELAGSPMHNPFGRLKLVSMRDIAETN
jgi:hypothetical protein